MINEALRPARQRSKHLSRISHHFMSDAQAPQTGAPQQLQLSVLVTADLVRQEAATLGPLTRVLNQQFRQQQPAAEFCFRPLNHPQPSNMRQDDPLLLLVDPSLPGMRLAYRQIKGLVDSVRPAIGVVIQGGRDPFQARRYYRRLAVGCLRFLNQPIANLGWLPADPRAREEQLPKIAARMRREHFYQRAPRGPDDE